MVLPIFRETLTGTQSIQPLDSIPDFPYSEYDQQWAEYTQAERWFSGAAMDDQPENSGKSDIYPMRINPIIGTVLKHASVLFGEVENDGRPLIVTKFICKDDSEKPLAEEAEYALNRVWFENKGRALMVMNGIQSQIYGGCVFKVRYAPREGPESASGWREIPFAIESINPKAFIGYPASGDDFRLLECWIVKEIRKAEAKLWGYEGDMDWVWWVEHQTRDRIDITVDGKPAVDVEHNNEPLSGPNIWGECTVVYIPHIRAVDFRGFNAFTHLTRYVKELNARWGDLGDATNDDSHPLVAARNVNGTIQMKRVNDWFEYADLGSGDVLGSNKQDPDLFQVGKPRVSEAMVKMTDDIYRQYRRDSMVPAVADGEDEGSQRSGLTLAIRFWPLTSHSMMERFFWTCGMDALQSLLLRMMALKQIANITRKHAQMRMKQVYAPMLPRDREIEVNEWGVRASNDIASADHLIELAGDVEDVKEERALLLKWIEDREKAKNKAAMELQQAQLDAQAQQAQLQADTQLDVAETSAETQKETTAMMGETQMQVAKSQPKMAGGKPGGKPKPKPGGKK